MKQREESVSFRAFLGSERCFLLFGGMLVLIFAMFFAALRIDVMVGLMLIGFLVIFLVGILLYNYYRRRKFYQNLLLNIEKLEESYLVLETLEKPRFFDGVIMSEAMYEIDKSMNENVKRERKKTRDFKEYVEAWIHEVKTPLAAMNLLAKDDEKILAELYRLNKDVEQILYYVRAETAEKDYVIQVNKLDKIIHEVLTENQESIRLHKVEPLVEVRDMEVYTDAKWLKFIIGQVVANSLKYGAKEIRFSAKTRKTKTDTAVILKIRDDGIGILEKDLPRVFEKSFTGTNGRKEDVNSTGMGLYIAKNLCDKLAHKIRISSEVGKFTEVKIEFHKTQYFNVTKK